MQPFRQEVPRAEADVLCQCFANPVLFLDWDVMPEPAQKEFDENGPIPCAGGGLPGEWCSECRFGVVMPPERR